MAEWKNKPKLSDLKTDYEGSKEITTSHSNRVEQWLSLLDAESPVPKEDAEKGKPRSRVQPKLIRKNNEWRFSALSEAILSTPDFYRFNPVTWEDTDLAKQHESVINYQFRNLIGKTKLIDRAVRDFVNTGTLILKPTWVQEKRKVETTVPIYTYTQIIDQAQLEQVSQLYQQMTELKKASPDSYETIDEALRAGLEFSVQQEQETGEQGLYVAEKTSEKVVQEDKVIVNRPYIEVCDYRDVFVDPTCKEDIRNAKFVIHRFELSKADLEADPRYDLTQLNTEGKDNEALLQGSSLNDERFIERAKDAINGVNNSFKFQDEARRKYVVYEYWGFWDTEGNGELSPIVCAWTNDVIIRLDDNPYPDLNIPFCFGAYLPQKDTVYGEPDAELIGDNQAIVGALVRGMLDTLGRSANSQTGLPKDFLDAVNQERFIKGKDYFYNPTQHPNNALVQHQYPVISPSVPNIIAEQINDAESLTGVKSFGTGGITGDSLGETAAGARLVNDATIQRTTAILRRLLDCFVDVAKKVVAMNEVYLTEKEVTRITNKPYIAPRDIHSTSSFDINMTIATAEADAQKANDLGFILQTATGNMPPELSQKILAEICRLKKMPDFAKEIEEYQPQPDPLAEAERQADIELKKAQAELLRAQAQESLNKANLNNAKVSETEAKTNHVNTQTNGKEIDNMSEMTGVKHQQQLDMQKQKDDAKLIQQEHNNLSKESIENVKAMAQMEGKKADG